jgi:ER membrane protein complex subunit 2
VYISQTANMSEKPEPSPFSDPQDALQLARKAPTVLSKSSSIATTFPMSLVGTPESPEAWLELTTLFYACLRTGDDRAAHLALERMTKRFGESNDRVMAMRGMYQEAVAQDEAELRSILQDYNRILSENPVNVPILKRRIALVRSMGREQDAIQSLVDFVEAFPTDVEAWAELADLYQAQGLGAQAVFCLEEALLTVPNAWNLHARLGELEYMNAATAGETSEAGQTALAQAVQRFSRSIELCDDYLRGYYGLKLSVLKLLKTVGQTKAAPFTDEKLQKLDQLASAKLKAIISARKAEAIGDGGEAELIAAQALLDRAD